MCSAPGRPAGRLSCKKGIEMKLSPRDRVISAFHAQALDEIDELRSLSTLMQPPASRAKNAATCAAFPVGNQAETDVTKPAMIRRTESAFPDVVN
jgi:hypothetical protein